MNGPVLLNQVLIYMKLGKDEPRLEQSKIKKIKFNVIIQDYAFGSQKLTNMLAKQECYICIEYNNIKYDSRT